MEELVVYFGILKVIGSLGFPWFHCSSSDQSEFKALKKSFELAISNGTLQLDINSDSHVLIQSLVNNMAHANLSTILHDCRWFLHQLQSFTISHVFREENVVADLLAKYGNEHPEQLFLYNSPLPLF